MNWDRGQLKQMARNALHGSYWKSVLAAFLANLAAGAFASTGTGTANTEEMTNFSYSFDRYMPYILMMVFFAGAFGLALRIFLFRPLEVGCKRYFLEDIIRPAELDSLKAGFSGNYRNIVWVMFCRDIFIFLWSLLFIIPGIVKSYEYRMIPYIMAEDPDTTREEAFALSKQMMDGEKMDTFILELSFLGWALLSICTCGLVGIFYYQPYLALTDAALYQTLKQKVYRYDNDGYNNGGYNNGGYDNDGYNNGGYNNGGYNNGGYNNGGYNNGGYNNGGYNDGGYDNGGYNNGGYNNGGYNNGGYNNGGYNNGGYNNGGYDNGGYNNGGYNNGGYNNGGYDNGGYNNGGYNNGGYDNGGYNNGGYNNSGYNNNGGYNDGSYGSSNNSGAQGSDNAYNTGNNDNSSPYSNKAGNYDFAGNYNSYDVADGTGSGYNTGSTGTAGNPAGSDVPALTEESTWTEKRNPWAEDGRKDNPWDEDV